MKGARGVLINITGGSDMTLFEVDEAANRIGEEVDADANIIFGSTTDSSLENKMRVSVVATGIDAATELQPRPVLKVYSQAQKLVRKKETAIKEDSASAQVSLTDDLHRTNSNQSSETRKEGVGTVDTVALEMANSEDFPDVESSVIRDEREEDVLVSDSTSTQHETTGKSKLAPSEPRLVSKNEAFIPPAPMDPKTTLDTKPGSDPFKEADLLNGGPTDSQPRRSGSLFRRITGSNKGSPPPAPSVTPPAPEPREKQKQQPEISTPKPEQESLVGVAPDDKIESSQSEEDLLEIPAFLRRQAN